MLKNIQYLLQINRFDVANKLFDAYNKSTTGRSSKVIASIRREFRVYINNNNML